MNLWWNGSISDGKVKEKAWFVKRWSSIQCLLRSNKPQTINSQK